MKFSNTILVVVLLLLVTSVSAQEKLNVIQQAMRDEMDRNMKELKSEGFDKPFFINYTLQDQDAWQMTASLGALVNSIESKGRVALSLRLLVGDYDFNDESLDNNLYSQPQANEISMPLDDDYLGIRRSLWVSTDNIYRNASRQFQKNKEMLREQGKPLAEIPHRSFAKVPPSKVDVTMREVKFDRKTTEDYIRKVSAVFANYPEIDNSNVAFFYRRGYKYLINSEGSVNRVPVTSASLVMAAGLKTSAGEFVFDNVEHSYLYPELPPIETMMAEAKAMAESMIASKSAPAFREEYVGPVMFAGETAANLIVGQLFASEDGLVANNNIQSLKGYQYQATNAIDTKIGKVVFQEHMTVKATPKRKKFGDADLLGSFDVDDEGVVPADETVLIENGVLKTLVNDRTLVKPGQIANGLGSGPGVLEVAFNKTVANAEMKSKLIALAKKDGLEYGLLIRSSSNVGSSRLTDVYKVYVADGREELVRQATMKDITQRNFRKITDASREVEVHHVGRGGNLISVICPGAIILEEVEFGESGFPTYKEEEYVPSPLKK